MGRVREVKTNAERCAAYRNRRKDAGLGQFDKDRDRQRKREERLKLQQNRGKFKDHRLKEVLRKRRARSANAAVTDLGQQQLQNPYKNVQSLGKAIARVRKSLPTCHVKSAFVITKLAEEFGLKVVNRDTLLSPDKSIKSGSITQETKDLVTNFYRTNEISWQSPNKKDVQIVRERDENGTVKKTYFPKRYLLMSLKEVFIAFQTAYPDVKIGFSKFHALKPVEVDTFTHIPHSVCLCIFHENVRLLLHAMHPFSEIPTDFREFFKNVTCDQDNENCMMRKCNACLLMVNGFDPANFMDNAESAPVVLEQWVTIEGRTTKSDIPTTPSLCFKMLKDKLSPFLRHVYIKRTQAQIFQHITNNADGRRVVLQVDFAENFSIIQQQEVQSAHWSHDQCTVFTGHIWAENCSRGYVIVSNHLEHGKISVYKYLDAILTDVENYTDIRELIIFSDGAASQFKQRYTLSLLPVFSQRYGIEISWYFFATSHGKGVVDGHGGDAKGAVWRRIRCGAKVKSAKDFADIARVACPRLKVIYVPKEEVDVHRLELEEHWRDVKPIANLQSVHCVRLVDHERLATKTHAHSDEKLSFIW